MATRNRYAELMAQYQQAQPFSFTGYPSSYTGGYDVAPYQPYVAPVNRYQEIMAQGASGGGMRANQEAPSAWSQMTPAERAAYYSANPTEGKIALGMQDLFGNATLLGQLAKNFNADNYYNSRLEKQGFDPQQFAYGPPDLRGGGGSGDGGNPLGDRGAQGEGYHGIATGGLVSTDNLQGPNPTGPDDGYSKLKLGEYVINDKAVKKYGIELMDAINSGKISKGKLRGLLEM